MASSIQAIQLRAFHLHPGGNDTYVVFGPGCDRASYPDINRTLLQAHKQLEQGGFIERASDSRAVARLQMAGGEFCGNGSRSCAALLLHDALGSKQFAELASYSNIRRDGDEYTFLLEVSGASSLLPVRCSVLNAGYSVHLEMPLPAAGITIRNCELKWDGQSVPSEVVLLEGIAHILVRRRDLEKPLDPETKKSIFSSLVAQAGLSDQDAVGLMIVDESEGRRHLQPTVWVRSTNTLYDETACGSGSIALAYQRLCALNLDKFSGEIVQPSGVALKTTVLKNAEGKLTSATIEGPVDIRGELDIPLA